MCVYSMVVDHYYDKWRPLTQPTIEPFVLPQITIPPQVPTQAEIDEFRELLNRAREYDKRNNQPDCELESKKQRVLELAKELGIADKINFL